MSADRLDLAEIAARAWPQITGAPVPVMIRENAVFPVETTAGPHALRLHRPGYHDDAALASELAWMAMLARGGVPVPVPMALEGGGFLHTGTRRASLLSWEEGSPLARAVSPWPCKARSGGWSFTPSDGRWR